MKKSKGNKRPAGLGAALLALTAVILTAALAVDSCIHLGSTRYDLGFPKLPESFEGFKILQFSDLHGMSFGEDNSRLVELAADREPDLIVFTGDMAGPDGDLKELEDLLRGLEGLAPIYFVNGNHEWADRCVPELRALMASYGAIELSSRMELFYRGEDAIVLLGSEDPNGAAGLPSPWDLSLEAGSLYPELFKLWLVHRNDYLELYPDLGADLILCGHAHGGIVRLPGLGGLLNTEHGLGAEYEIGLYRGEHYIMAVSRGLGNSVPVPRFLNRPELVEIVLHSQS